MVKYRWIAALLAVWLGVTAGVTVSSAKPPDLPAKNDVRCQDEGQENEVNRLRLERDTTTGIVRVEFDTASQSTDDAGPPCIDAWCPNIISALAQRVAQRILMILQPGAVSADADEVMPNLDFSSTAEQARQLYLLAGRCIREGKFTEARAHLREAHLANPTCPFGRLAIERLQELEAPKSEEPQSDDDETAAAERAFRRVRETTQPLGLVQTATY